MRRAFVFSFFLAALPVCICRADFATLQPSADTTLIQTAPDNNLGGATFFNAGVNGRGKESRGLFAFDLSQIPAGSIINSATLTLEVVREPAENSTPSTFAFHRVLQSWGEGDKTPGGTPEFPESPGLGSPATAGDATWNDRFFGSTPWSTPGGAVGVDFAGLITTELAVAGTFDSPYTVSDSGLIGDLQYWIDHPEANFGWMLLTESSDTPSTARSFAAHEDFLQRGPLLEIDFTVVPEPSTLGLIGLAMTALFPALLRRLRRP